MITLQDIRTSYRNCHSFACDIEFLRRFHRTPIREEKKWAKLLFKRAQTLDIEWADVAEPQPHRLIWKDGRAIRYQPNEDRWQEEESVEMALAADAGISGGVAYFIPSLLLG